MDGWLKIRVPSSSLAAWKQHAGHQNLSAWVRGCCDEEMKRNPRPTPVRRTYLHEMVSEGEARPVPPGVVLGSESPKCRHGLENCSVCGTGVFDGQQD